MRIKTEVKRARPEHVLFSSIEKRVRLLDEIAFILGVLHNCTRNQRELRTSDVELYKRILYIFYIRIRVPAETDFAGQEGSRWKSCTVPPL